MLSFESFSIKSSFLVKLLLDAFYWKRLQSFYNCQCSEAWSHQLIGHPKRLMNHTTCNLSILIRCQVDDVKQIEWKPTNLANQEIEPTSRDVAYIKFYRLKLTGSGWARYRSCWSVSLPGVLFDSRSSTADAGWSKVSNSISDGFNGFMASLSALQWSS